RREGERERLGTGSALPRGRGSRAAPHTIQAFSSGSRASAVRLSPKCRQRPGCGGRGADKRRGPRREAFGAPQRAARRNHRRRRDDLLYGMRVKRIYLAAAFVSVCAIVSVSGQSGAQNGEWRSYGGDI